MKKNYWNLLTLLWVALVSAFFVSCSKDDDKETKNEPETELTVSPTEISLMAEKNSEASFTITANESWTASLSQDGSWLNLSARSGNKGSNNITVTARSANASSEERTAEITILCGSKSEVVTVTQLPGFEDVRVNFNTNSMIKLTTSIAFEQTYSGPISYYYAGYLKKSVSAGWTDDKIEQTLRNDFEAQQPEDDDVMSIDGLTPNTAYYLCAVAYDADGNRGPVTKVEVTTAKTANNRPSVNITNVSYSSTKWEWETYIGAYASKYYMVAESGIDAAYYILSADALVAYYIKKGADNGNLTPIVQSGSWSMSRNSSDEYFYCAAWAQDSNGKFANELDVFWGSLSEDSKVRKAPAQQKPKVSVHKQSDYKKFKVFTTPAN